MFRSKKFNVRLYTCNYGEAGNILRRKMYKVRKCVSESRINNIANASHF